MILCFLERISSGEYWECHRRIWGHPVTCVDNTRNPERSSIPALRVTSERAVLTSLCAHVLSRVQLFATHGLKPARLLRPWDFPGKSTEVGCHFLFQGSSQPRDRTCTSSVSSLAGGFSTTSATWEAPKTLLALLLLSRFSRVQLRGTPQTAAPRLLLDVSKATPKYYEVLEGKKGQGLEQCN